MSKGGGTKTQYVTQNTSSAPWGPQQAYLTKGFERAGDWLESSQPDYYPESTVIGFSPQEEQALRWQEQVATSVNPLDEQAKSTFQNIAGGQWVGQNPTASFLRGRMNDGTTGQQALTATARGDRLQSNPQLDAVVSQSMADITKDFKNAVVPGLQGAFGSAGRVGSNSHAQAINEAQDTLAETMAKTATSLRYSDYDRERDRQLAAAENLNANAGNAAQVLGGHYVTERAQQVQAAGMLPQLGDLEYDDIQKLSEVGAARGELGQAQLQDKINRFNHEQNKEANKLGAYMSLIGGGFGGEGSTVKPVYYNRGANILSGATSGAMLAQMAGVNPMYGAAAGGLLGYRG